MDYTFKIGTPVFAEDGKVGRLKFVVIDSYDEEVTDLIVDRGPLPHQSIVVPTGWVNSTGNEGIYLNANLKDLEDLPEYREVEFQVPEVAAKQLAGFDPEDVRIWVDQNGPIPEPGRAWLFRRMRLVVDQDEILVGRNNRVTDVDGEVVGSVNHVIVDPSTREVTSLVVRRHFGIAPDMLIPRELIASLGEKHVRLKLHRDELKDMPEYHPVATDQQLENRVKRAIETQPETRGKGLDIELDRGVVKLLGDVPESVAKAATSVARRIHGVIGVDDRTKTRV
ncbi:MAG TPA: PRC-barrel domain-containing protein [Nitrolancea sp.]|jgi:uncharacterized protein YrrD|nr:PRC-barrel domain-containing protein [Nitrolancea sp.]